MSAPAATSATGSLNPSSICRLSAVLREACYQRLLQEVYHLLAPAQRESKSRPKLKLKYFQWIWLIMGCLWLISGMCLNFYDLSFPAFRLCSDSTNKINISRRLKYVKCFIKKLM